MRKFDLAGGSSDSTSTPTDLTEVLARLAAIEAKEVLFISEFLISQASGTLTFPVNCSMATGAEAYYGLHKVVDGVADKRLFVYDSEAVPVWLNLSSNGEYTLSGTPASYPVAIVVRLKTTALNYDSSLVNTVNGRM